MSSQSFGFASSHVWIGEGNGNPLQYSCLETPVDRVAWWAAVHGVTQSWTWLKQVSIHACVGEGNCNPLQYSCLEIPRDKGAWWAAVYGVAQSQTRLKRLSSNSIITSSVQFSSVAQSCPTLCDPMDWSTPGLPVHYQLPEFTETHAHLLSDAI